MLKQFGMRKNVSKTNDKERNAFLKALIALNMDKNYCFPGSREDRPFVGGVSYWFKQDEIHQATPCPWRTRISYLA